MSSSVSSTESMHVSTLRAALLIIESPAIKGLSRGTVTVDEAMREIVAIIERETAAPELLEALRDALTSLEHFYEKAAQQAFVHKQVALPWPEITRGREAIAKAEGRA